MRKFSDTPRGVYLVRSRYAAKINLLNILRIPRQIGTFLLEEDAALAVDSARWWLRHGGTPPEDFVFSAGPVFKVVPPPLYPWVIDFGYRVLEALEKHAVAQGRPFEYYDLPPGLSALYQSLLLPMAARCDCLLVSEKPVP